MKTNSNPRIKIIRASTIPASLNTFCKGLLKQLQEEEGYEVIALSSPGEALEQIHKQEGVKVIPVSILRNISPFNDLKSLWRLFKIFRKEKPMMVHSITPKAGLLCMMAAWMARVPIRMHTFTGLLFPTTRGIKQKILILTDRITCACATHITPEGEGVKHDLQQFKITRKPLKVLGYGNIRGIDLSYYDRTTEVIANASKIRNNELFTFIFVGRIVRDKGINELISAFTRLYDEYTSIRLLLVGKFENDIDPISSDTDKIIKSHPAIETPGVQSDVRPWFAASDALVFPSYREGFPNVVIEAGAMGLPSIVTDINGSREIIEDGKNGIIIPSHNSSALYEAMKNFITEPEKLAKMAKNTRGMIDARYNHKFVRDCLINHYSTILSTKKQ